MRPFHYNLIRVKVRLRIKSLFTVSAKFCCIYIQKERVRDGDREIKVVFRVCDLHDSIIIFLRKLTGRDELTVTFSWPTGNHKPKFISALPLPVRHGFISCFPWNTIKKVLFPEPRRITSCIQTQTGIAKHKYYQIEFLTNTETHTCFWCVVSLLRYICCLWEDWEDASQNNKDQENTPWKHTKVQVRISLLKPLNVNKRFYIKKKCIYDNSRSKVTWQPKWCARNKPSDGCSFRQNTL